MTGEPSPLSATALPSWLADLMPLLADLMSVVAMVVAAVAIWVSVATSRNLQNRQQRFELLATCLEDLSGREKKASQLVRWEVLNEYDEESVWSYYEGAVETYKLMKHHLLDVADLEKQIKRVEDFRSRFRAGERQTPDGRWDLREALHMEAASFVWLLKDSVAKALYGTDPPPRRTKWGRARSAGSNQDAAG